MRHLVTIAEYIEAHIPHFHQRRLDSLTGLRLERILARIAVNGRSRQQNKGDYLKLCGQPFWALISGESEMYRQLIAPLGQHAKERNEEFAHEYAKVINRFTAAFLSRFCRDDGAIDWDRLVAFNSADPAALPSCLRNSR